MNTPRFTNEDYQRVTEDLEQHLAAVQFKLQAAVGRRNNIAVQLAEAVADEDWHRAAKLERYYRAARDEVLRQQEWEDEAQLQLDRATN
jgi:hypothetical protein